MKRIRLTIGALGMAAWLVAGAAPAAAGTSFEFLFSTNRVSNDHQLFLNLAVSNSGYDRAVLEPVLPRIQYVEVDLPVVLFVARQCGQPVDVIVDLRARGLSWSVIFTQLHVAPDVLFVGIDRDPGPPYGKAWGHWKQNRSKVKLSDDEVRGLVQVQMGSRWAGASPYQLARARSQGKSVVTYVADRHGRPFQGGGQGKEKGNGKQKGHGRGKG
ncbi:MAG: hypothetical protein L0Z52_08295 [Acidobacteria bacterium]|nr:hypothetical protein [Acidobacteriota bacterium]